MEWPPYLPDQNPIENLRAFLKAGIFKQYPELMHLPTTRLHLNSIIYPLYGIFHRGSLDRVYGNFPEAAKVRSKSACDEKVNLYNKRMLRDAESQRLRYLSRHDLRIGDTPAFPSRRVRSSLPVRHPIKTSTFLHFLNTIHTTKTLLDWQFKTSAGI